MSEQFYRFQKTTALEKESYSEVISDIFFMIGGEENDWKELSIEDKNEILQEIKDKWNFAIELWWDKYKSNYNNTDDPTSRLVDILSDLDESAVWNFMMKNKLNGVFAIKVEDFLNKEELFEASQNVELGIHNDY